MYIFSLSLSLVYSFFYLFLSIFPLLSLYLCDAHTLLHLLHPDEELLSAPADPEPAHPEDGLAGDVRHDAPWGALEDQMKSWKKIRKKKHFASFLNLFDELNE